MALTTEVFARCLEIQIQSLQDQLGLLRGEEGATQSKTKKKKKVVDPNKPKRAHTAYTLYIMDILPKLKAAHPNKIQKELITMAASQWSQLDEESKKVFVDAAARDKEEVHKKMTAYNESHTHPAVNGSTEASAEEVASPAVVPEENPSKEQHKKKKKKDKKRKSDAGDESSHHHKSLKTE